jgi:hypothetical protein
VVGDHHPAQVAPTRDRALDMPGNVPHHPAMSTVMPAEPHYDPIIRNLGL